MQLEVAKGGRSTLVVSWNPKFIHVRLAYHSGLNYEISISQEQWDRLVAWVELQRKEKALEEATTKK